PPRIRVVVQLPYNRPDHPPPRPSPCAYLRSYLYWRLFEREYLMQIEWNTEKANVLWEVIALSRTSDNGGTDWKGLAEHLEVPLPYLLYRAQARYEDDLRGLQGFHAGHQQNMPATKSTEVTPVLPDRPLSIKIPAARIQLPQQRPQTLLLRLSTPLGVRDSEDEQAAKEEEADRAAEEEAALSRKLENLQRMMTSEGKARDVIRGRAPVPISRAVREGEDIIDVKERNRDHSASGSIPSIPSPPPESQSPMARHISTSKSSSPPTVSTRNARGQSNMRYTALAGLSEQESSHGSSASSFSDISGVFFFLPSSPPKTLDDNVVVSALMSNNTGAGSRLSAIARSRFVRGVRL
ncbi:hypothetical protein DFH29DRAFT_914558, partial [Suillus ampliporus]